MLRARDIPQFNILGAWPGPSLWGELSMKGFIDEDMHWESPIAASKICPEAVPFDEHRAMGQEALGEFIGRPGFILAQIAARAHSIIVCE